MTEVTGTVSESWQMRIDEEDGVALAFGEGPFILVDNMSQVEAQEAAKLLATGMRVWSMAAAQQGGRLTVPKAVKRGVRNRCLGVASVAVALAVINLYYSWVAILQLHMWLLVAANSSSAFACSVTAWMWFLKSRKPDA